MQPFVHVVTLVLLVLGLVLGMTPASATGTDTALLRAALTSAGIRTHLAAFQRIADAHGGTRAAGTAGYDASVTYVRDQLLAAGYRVHLQAFPYLYFAVERQAAQLLGPAARDLAPRAMVYAPSTPPGGLTRPVAVVPSEHDAGAGCEATDFRGQVYTDTIALIARGGCPFAQKARHAQQAGAAAVLVYNTDPDPHAALAGTLGGAEHATVPVAGIPRAAGEELIAAVRAGPPPVQITLDLQTTTETRTTANVVADTPWGDPEQVVLAGAHLDSVPAGAGINDNGSGVATLLEVAQQLAAHGVRTDTTLRFAFWGAEELGLLGSQHYVAQLSSADRAHLQLYLNLDMVGSPNSGRFVYADAQTGFDTAAGRQTIAAVFHDYFATRGLPVTTIPVGDRSDHAPFAAAGIPVGGLFAGAEGIKTTEEAARVGGTAGAAYDGCYHRACDDLTNVNAQALDELGDAAMHALVTLARLDAAATQPPPRGGTAGDAGACAQTPVRPWRPVAC